MSRRAADEYVESPATGVTTICANARKMSIEEFARPPTDSVAYDGLAASASSVSLAAVHSLSVRSSSRLS